MPIYLVLLVTDWCKNDNLMVAILPNHVFIHLQRWDGGGGVVQCVQVCEEDFQCGFLACWYRNYLFQCSKRVKYITYTQTIEITTNNKIYIIAVFGSKYLYCVNDMIYCVLFMF